MSDVKLFNVERSDVCELKAEPVKLEKDLQTLMERNLEVFLGVRLVASEYSTGKKHAGRIDTLGLDENGCPTIIEYKRYGTSNVINQGLFYLDWLMDHQAEFELLVLKKFGEDEAQKIDWSGPRLLCIAENFDRYDVYAVQQINRNIELIRYLLFEEELLLLSLVNVVVATPEKEDGEGETAKSTAARAQKYTTQAEYLEKADSELRELYEAVREHMIELGDDVQEKKLKWYIAFKRLKNFACVQLQTQKNSLLMWLPINPETVDLEDGFSRDVTDIGHHGVGDLELTIRDVKDLERAAPLILRSYEDN